MNAQQILDREFLEIRAKILEIAASLDRIDRADGSVQDSAERKLVAQGIDILSSDSVDRAEQVQMLFSRQYQADWQREFDLAPRV